MENNSRLASEDRRERPVRRSAHPARTVTLMRTNSRAADVIHLLSKVYFGLSVVAHIVIYIVVANSVPRMNFGIIVTFIISLLITALVAWLIDAIAEPFDHVRACADSLTNIETMMVKQMSESGVQFKEEYYK